MSDRPLPADSCSHTLERIRQSLEAVQHVAGNVAETRGERAVVAEMERRMLGLLAEEAAMIFQELDLPEFFVRPAAPKGLFGRKRGPTRDIQQKVLALRCHRIEVTPYISGPTEERFYQYVLLTDQGMLSYATAQSWGGKKGDGPGLEEGETGYPSRGMALDSSRLHQVHLHEWEDLEGDCLPFSFEKLQEALEQTLLRTRANFAAEQESVRKRTEKLEQVTGRLR